MLTTTCTRLRASPPHGPRSRGAASTEIRPSWTPFGHLGDTGLPILALRRVHVRAARRRPAVLRRGGRPAFEWGNPGRAPSKNPDSSPRPPPSMIVGPSGGSVASNRPERSSTRTRIGSPPVYRIRHSSYGGRWSRLQSSLRVPIRRWWLSRPVSALSSDTDSV